MPVLLMPAQTVNSLGSKLDNQNCRELAQCSLSPPQRRCLESPIQHSLLELGGAAMTQAPGQELWHEPAAISQQTQGSTQQQQKTPGGITTNERAVAVEGGYHSLGSTARIRNCLPSSGHAQGFDKYSCTSRG